MHSERGQEERGGGSRIGMERGDTNRDSERDGEGGAKDSIEGSTCIWGRNSSTSKG